jgi:mRNA interferase MazF
MENCFLTLMTKGWPGTMIYRRGDVVLTWFPHSDLETFKKRPAVLVQSDAMLRDLPQRTCLMISRTPRAGAYRVRVRKDSPEGAAMGILADFTIHADHIQTLDDKLIIKKIGRCTCMEQVDDALRAALDL